MCQSKIMTHFLTIIGYLMFRKIIFSYSKIAHCPSCIEIPSRFTVKERCIHYAVHSLLKTSCNAPQLFGSIYYVSSFITSLISNTSNFISQVIIQQKDFVRLYNRTITATYSIFLTKLIYENFKKKMCLKYTNKIKIHRKLSLMGIIRIKFLCFHVNKL